MHVGAQASCAVIRISRSVARDSSNVTLPKRHDSHIVRGMKYSTLREGEWIMLPCIVTVCGQYLRYHSGQCDKTTNYWLN